MRNRTTATMATSIVLRQTNTVHRITKEIEAEKETDTVDLTAIREEVAAAAAVVEAEDIGHRKIFVIGNDKINNIKHFGQFGFAINMCWKR